MTIDNLVAEIDIRNVMASYNQALDDMRWDELAAQFTGDCVIRFPSGTINSPAQLVAILARGRQALLAGEPRGKPLTIMRHHLASIFIEVEGDRAKGRSYFLVVADAGPDHTGIYLDRFSRVDGRWLIAEREAVVEWQAETSLWPAMV